MINKFQMFEKVVKFSSGIGQRINNRLHEVTVHRVTLKRELIDNDFKLLNNHDCLLYKNRLNEEVIKLYTTKEESKGLGDMKGTKIKNDEVSEVSIDGLPFRQYISGSQIKVNRDIMNFNKSEKAEDFTKENSDSIIPTLNRNRDNDSTIEIKMKKIDD